MMPILLQAGSTLAFTVLPMAGSILLAFGIYQVVVESKAGQRKKLTDRLRERAPVAPSQSIESILRRTGTEAGDGFLSNIICKLSITPKLQGLLNQANVDWSASKMLTNQVLCAVVVVAGLLVFQINPFVALLAGVVILALPLWWLRFRRTRRMKRLTNQLPDVFEIMSQALRAGHSLASALEVVHDQLPDPVGTEFGRVFHEQNLGIKLEDALLSMADRVDSLDVRFFVTAVLIQRQTGGDLAEVLDKIGSVIRERIELFGMVSGLTAEGRLSGWVLFALPFIVFGAVVMLNPDYADTLFTEPAGRIMLAVALGMELMGLAMIRWIVNIKV